MGRLYSDSSIAYDSEDGHFAVDMDEKAKAVRWLVHTLQSSDIDLYGGYYGPAYYYQDLVLVVEPGHESQKYAGLDAWKIDDVIALYREEQEGREECGPDDDYESDFKTIENKRIILEGA